MRKHLLLVLLVSVAVALSLDRAIAQSPRGDKSGSEGLLSEPREVPWREGAPKDMRAKASRPKAPHGATPDAANAAEAAPKGRRVLASPIAWAAGLALVALAVSAAVGARYWRRGTKGRHAPPVAVLAMGLENQAGGAGHDLQRLQPLGTGSRRAA